MLHITFFLAAYVFSPQLKAQYVLNGTAQKNSCNCYTLTADQLWQSGSVWNSNKINLTQSFDFSFNVFLGCRGTGADGIVFMLQPVSTSIGTSGEGMGFEGVKPSLGIPLDTYQNTNQGDPFYDHISIQANGVIHHNSDLAGPVPISVLSSNVKDCRWHQLRITWDAARKWITVYFDGIIRLEKQVDMVGTIFNNDPMVFWGFTGATGGASNLQQFCTALNPDFKTNVPQDVACAPATIQFSDQSVSFTTIGSYQWNFGNGNTHNTPSPPVQQYPAAGTYTVTLKIRGMDGCENELSKEIKVASVPQAEITVTDVCYGRQPTIAFSAGGVGVQANWSLDNSGPSATIPGMNSLSPGMHRLQLTVKSLYNCGADAVAYKDFMVRHAPEIGAEAEQVCRQLAFRAEQLDQSTTIKQWQWQFGDGGVASNQNPSHVYPSSGSYSPQVFAVADNGCTSDTVTLHISIPQPYANAGNDTVVLQNIPFQLKGAGNGNFSWSPPQFLSNSTISNPQAVLAADQSFILTVTTNEGCVAKDTIYVKVMKGPAIYVPGAFTPNGDGRNDVLKPVYVGINQLKRFAVYNRWGQVVFQTSDMSKGWNGKLQQQDQSGTFVWVIEAVNYLDLPIQMKGTVTIIR